MLQNRRYLLTTNWKIMTNKSGYDRKRTWQMWLLTRSRQLAFALAMLIFLAIILIFGPSK
jgi:hypothetical protein